MGTIGVDFKMKKLEIDGKNIKCQIWDTAGQERFRTITHTYYKGAHGVIFVYDVTDMQSFQSLDNWMSEVMVRADEGVRKMLVGNKCDIKDMRKVPYDYAQDWASKMGMTYQEASAKTCENVDALFRIMIDEIYANWGTFGSSSPTKKRELTNSDFIENTPAENKKSNCC
eukprot:TRINITY_DN3437_c0_g1_i2.p1 TRINITY_DN3437_c0_g1~~TRINITY_DN3437_c0_g1_i2.p1  ORF type:complete len:170 (-),score=32.85 TRINITY_DN3437_c0_g1_i2:123-632(-)